MIIIKEFDKHFEVTDKDIVKSIPYENVIKWTDGIYNNKFIVRVAHKNGVYIMYADYKADQKKLMDIIERRCGRRS